MLQINSKIQIPLKEFEFSYARSPGPGGQNVNKLNTKVFLRWNIRATKSLPETVRERFCQKYHRRISNTGEVVIMSSRFRDQGRNVADTITKLKELVLSVAEEPKPRKKRRRSRAANERRIADKRSQSEKKKNRKAPRIDRS